MNIPCRKCGRILTVPDIPLPPGYTQKCPSCGYNNPVDDLELTANTFDTLDFSSLSDEPKDTPSVDGSSHFNQAVDKLFSAEILEADQLNHNIHGQRSRRSQVKRSASAPGTASNPAPALPNAAADTLGILEKAKAELRAEFAREQQAMDLKMNVLAEELRTLKEKESHADDDPAVSAGPVVANLAAALTEFCKMGSVLLCSQTPAVFQACEKQLTAMKFQIKSESGLEKAVKLQKEVKHQVVILDQRFLKGDLGKSLLVEMKQTPLKIRRCQVFVLLTPSLPSRESQVFYQWGFDLSVNLKELDKLGLYLAEVINLRNQLFDAYLTNSN